MTAKDKGAAAPEAEASAKTQAFHPPAPVAAPGAGAVLQGRYRLIEKLGEGAMGSVFRAERLELGRQVAVKFLGAGIARQPEFVQRFGVEARAMGRLSHPNCVSVIDFGVETLPYLVMDFVQGRTLGALIDAGRVPPRRAVAIARQILAGLAHAHEQGIVHRDVKPDNVLVEQSTGLDDHVRLVDFGLAKLLDSQSVLTVGLALGTPSYMAPEQMLEGTIDERVDLYATGVLMFELLTGSKPFDSPDVAAVLLAHQQKAPPSFRAVAPELVVSAALEAVVQRALQKKAAARFPSAKAMIAALDAVPEAQPQAALARARTPAFVPSPLTRPPGAGLKAVPPPPIPARAAPPPPMPMRAAPPAVAPPPPAEPPPAAAPPGLPAASGGQDRTVFEARPAGALVPEPRSDEAPVSEQLSAGDNGRAERNESALGAALGRLDWRVRVGAAAALAAIAILILVAYRRADAPADRERRGRTGVTKMEARTNAPAPAATNPSSAAAARSSDEEAALAVTPAPAAAAAHSATPPPAAPVATPAPAAAAATLEEIEALAGSGKTDEALLKVQARRRAQPRDAAAAALAARLLFEQRRFAEGIAAARQAVRVEAARKNDPALINGAIAALANDRTATEAEGLLRDTIGAPAKPHLKQAAKEHESAVVRKRARALLASWGRKPFLRWTF